MDRTVGVWCESYDRGQLFCIRWRSGSAQGKGDLPQWWNVELRNFSALAIGLRQSCTTVDPTRGSNQQSCNSDASSKAAATVGVVSDGMPLKFWT